MDNNLQLCLDEGWELNAQSKINANGREYPISHPYQIYLSIYRDSTIPLEKYHAMQKVHDYLWPHLVLTNNYWQERMFKAHCGCYKEGSRIIVLASGAGIGKSDVCARIGIIYWLAKQKERAVIISSTTLDSLEKRIWGYIVMRMTEARLPIPHEYKKQKPPKYIYPKQQHELAGLFTAAIREGEDSRTLSTAIGKHPKDGLLVFLDESPDISPTIVDAITNWEQGTPYFQLFALGNSKSKNDLHGALAKPKAGWDSITVDMQHWPTAQEGGLCLYFNPHDSPAIHETNPIKKAALSKFLITQEKLDKQKKKYGVHSDNYYRQVLGFWKPSAIEEVVITDKRLKESNPFVPAEFSGLFPVHVVAGLDPAIDDESKGCVLRFGLLGHTTDGFYKLDYRSDKLVHYISTAATQSASPEKQLVDNIILLLLKFNCPLSSLAIDATGLGRLLGELLKQRLQTDEDPIKIVSRRGGGISKDKDHNLLLKSPLEMYENLTSFIQYGQVRGIDHLTAEQLYSRLVIEKGKTRELESKKDFKKRMAASNPELAQSPDECDAATLCLLAANIKYGFTLGQYSEIQDPNMFYNLKYRTFLLAQKDTQGQLTPDAQSAPIPRPITAGFKSSIESTVKVNPNSFPWQRNQG